MYGKIFREIFDSSIVVNGGDVIYTFIALIVLSDPKGFVRITIPALATRIAKDIKVVQKAIDILQSPDPNSTTADHDGRRIISLAELSGGEENRGWWIVNYEKYRARQSAETVREQTRERVRRHREAKQSGNADVTHVTVGNARKRQEEGEEEGLTIVNNIPGLDLSAWEMWVAYRKAIKKPLKAASLLAAMKKLAGFGADQKAIVEQTIANGWQGIFPLKTGTGNGNDKGPDNSAPGRVRRAYGLGKR